MDTADSLLIMIDQPRNFLIPPHKRLQIFHRPDRFHIVSRNQIESAVNSIKSGCLLSPQKKK